MLIWVNGAFGSGKTTLVAELRGHLPDALVFDPEQVGGLLTGIVDCPTGNFQDIPLWRRQVAGLAAGLHQEYGRTVLVPMNLMTSAYMDEIFGGLRDAGVPYRHFCLRVPTEVLLRRIDERHRGADGDPARVEAGRRWCREQIEAYAAAPPRLPGDTVVLDGLRPPAELAAQVLAAVRGAPVAG
ncbi:AAA family ATPase [Streptomyces sp. NRRL F-5123]|uniref:AAA family ATPase n=1 Tax=Streptomyces sp. NRRL F-5123 TaxID=1463856 RepID=UPI0004E20731|nr:AAA family ATPase [Streptomyces sp. NRRL F-5123]